ncbi:MAG: site-specific integrase [Candidatus Electrothrix communis]|nr:MAG: site-specific integrase [Candidatus Electrothrix communis]
MLQRLYSHAIKKTGYSGPNPCLKVDKPTIDNEVTEFLTDSELNRLMKTLNSWPDKMIAGIVKFAILTGLRKGEILTLTWNHVNLEQKSVYLKSPKGKKSITLPLSENACSVLQGLSRHDESLYVFHHWQGKPYNDVRKSWLNIKKQAELPTAFRFHGLRHSFASALVSAGTSLHIVSKLLTHKNTKVTERYSHLSDKALRDALKLSDTLQQKKEPAEIIYLKQQQHG